MCKDLFTIFQLKKLDKGSRPKSYHKWLLLRFPEMIKLHNLCLISFLFLKRALFGETCFLSSVAVLGSVLQMGLISDRPHTILRVDGVYFYEGTCKFPSQMGKDVCRNEVTYTFSVLPFLLCHPALSEMNNKCTGFWSVTVQPWHDDWFAEVCSWCTQERAALSWNQIGHR